MRYTIFLLLLTIGCGTDDKLEDVTLLCTDDLGYETPPPDSARGLDRANCYRTAMGLEPGVLSRALDEASQAHAEYMNGANTMTHQELPIRGGFTGEWVWDRVESVGYDCCIGRMVSEVVSYGYDPAGAVDGWVQSVYHRAPFTMPHWTEVGFGQSGDYSSMTFITPYPGHARLAVIYPYDGQVDVPPTFNSDWESPDPAPGLGVVGTPITVTVADTEVVWDEFNPYDLRLIEASLTGPGGEQVDVLLSDPGDDEALSHMAVMLPTAPLQSGAEYSAVMTVQWADEQETFTAVFSTGPADQ